MEEDLRRKNIQGWWVKTHDRQDWWRIVQEAKVHTVLYDDDGDTTFSFYLTLKNRIPLGHASNMPITAAPHVRTLTVLHMLSSYLQSMENKEQIYSTCWQCCDFKCALECTSIVFTYCKVGDNVAVNLDDKIYLFYRLQHKVTILWYCL
jgi:hypothetical protein